MCCGRVRKIIYSVISLDEDIIEGMAGASSDFETVYLQRRKITMVKAQRHL